MPTPPKKLCSYSKAIRQNLSIMPHDDNIKTGKYGEQLVAKILRRQGWDILDQNFRHIGTELDIIACKKGTLAVIEVKTRKTRGNSLRDLDLISKRKRISLSRGISHYLTRKQISVNTIRFDLAIVLVQNTKTKIRYIPNFFKGETEEIL